MTLACSSGPLAPDAGLSAPPFENCFPNPLPSCSEGTYRYEDYFCDNFGTALQNCARRGDGRCYDLCGDAGECAGGLACGCLPVNRCTHYRSFVKVCLAPGTHNQCSSGADGGAEADSGL